MRDRKTVEAELKAAYDHQAEVTAIWQETFRITARLRGELAEIKQKETKG